MQPKNIILEVIYEAKKSRESYLLMYPANKLSFRFSEKKLIFLENAAKMLE